MSYYAQRKGLRMSKANLLILGAGQYGQVVRETAQAMETFAKICFLDDNSSDAAGKLADYEKFSGEYTCAFVAVGNPVLRAKWLDQLEAAGFKLPILIHPKAYVSPSATIGQGTVVEPMAVVNTGATVGKGGLLCAGCVVNHNANVADCCQIDCKAVVAAGAQVPEGTKVASGTVYER